MPEFTILRLNVLAATSLSFKLTGREKATTATTCASILERCETETHIQQLAAEATHKPGLAASRFDLYHTLRTTTHVLQEKSGEVPEKKVNILIQHFQTPPNCISAKINESKMPSSSITCHHSEQVNQIERCLYLHNGTRSYNSMSK